SELVNSTGCGAVEREWLPTAVYDQIGDRQLAQSVDLGDLLRGLRQRKHPDEIALLEHCMLGGAAGQARAAQVVRPGCTELEMFREIQSAATAAVGCPVLLYGDFRATNAAVPKAGGLPTNRPLQPGDLLILDFSVVVNGYRSDFTNTLSVGTPTADQQSLFNTCVQALGRGEDMLRPEVSASEVYRVTSAQLESAGYDPLAHH
ncbi:MAG: M24 family metallopeptidase, partial [Planctomycetaceae bacterium]